MKFIFTTLLLIISVSLFAIELNLSDTTEQIDITSYCYHLGDESESLEIKDVIDKDWEPLNSSLDFGPVKYTQWVKFDIQNNEDHLISKSIFIPYHHIHEIDLYVVGYHRVKLAYKKGTMRYHERNILQSVGYDFPVLIAGGQRLTIYIRFKHLNRPLRASTFIVSQSKLDEINMRNFRVVWFWRGAFLFALLISITIYFFVRLKQFLYYFILNLGIGIYMASQLGDYFIFFQIDTYDITTLMDFVGAQIVVFFFPLFINELVAIRKRLPLLWKIMYISIYLGFFIVAISFYTPARLNIVQYYSHIYMMFLVAMVLLLQLVFLLISSIYRDKNAIVLLVVYTLYVSSAYINITLPNMGLIPSTPYVYNSLLIVSIIEIITFLFLMGRETMKIYDERQQLAKNEQEYQKKLILSIIKAQEDERNRVGRTIHDSIGGNMAIIRQSINNPVLESLLNKTLNEIRSLSHGLVSPQLKNDEFVDEIKELTYSSTTDNLKMHCHFYNWPLIENAEAITHIYRIIQELIQNALKHSKAANVHFQFIGENENYIDIVYEDDGVGFNYEKVKAKGLGLRNIENRLSVINGKFSVDSLEDRGTVIMIEIDLLKSLP